MARETVLTFGRTFTGTGAPPPRADIAGLDPATIIAVASAIGTTGAQLISAIRGRDGVPTFPEGADIEITPSFVPRKRRRRKRLLTCSDKADIAFITGTLGKGQTGQAALSSLLSRCG